MYWVLFLTLSGFGVHTLNATDMVKDIDEHTVKKDVMLEFELVDGLIVIQASCEGLSGNYILDTGAPQLMINQKVNAGDIDLWTSQGNQKGSSVDVTSFEFGSIAKEDVSALALDMTFIEALIGRPVAGILGNDMLKDYSVLIDYEQSVVNLIVDRASFTSSTVDYNITTMSIKDYMDEMPIVGVKVDGKEKLLAFDTGAAISVLDMGDGTKSSEANTSHKDIHINNVLVGAAPFTSIDLSELNTDGREDLDGILSVTSLNASKVLIDYSTDRIFLFWSKAI